MQKHSGADQEPAAAAAHDRDDGADGVDLSGDAWRMALYGFVGRQYGTLRAWDPVNQPMIRQWCEALGNDNPLYLDPDFAVGSVHGAIVAPPSMLNVWLMPGVVGRRPSGSPADDPSEIFRFLGDAGYGGVVATDCEQDYVRYIRPGEHLTQSIRVESISEEKRTALGDGHFVTTLRTYRTLAGEAVGTMRFGFLCYRPPRAGRAPPPQPGISDDTRFFWDGLKANKLLIQRCAACGLLRHPPGPVCMECHSFAWDTVEATGRGTVYSFVVMHHPQLPAFDYPHPVALVQLEEGTRLVAPLTGIDPAAIAIGMPVQVVFDNVDGEHRMPQFAPA